MKKNCPICKQVNQCQVELSTCWCMKINLAEAVKEELSTHQMDASCLCKTCLSRLSKGGKLIHSFTKLCTNGG